MCWNYFSPDFLTELTVKYTYVNTDYKDDPTERLNQSLLIPESIKDFSLRSINDNCCNWVVLKRRNWLTTVKLEKFKEVR